MIMSSQVTMLKYDISAVSCLLWYHPPRHDGNFLATPDLVAMCLLLHFRSLAHPFRQHLRLIGSNPIKIPTVAVRQKELSEAEKVGWSLT